MFRGQWRAQRRPAGFRGAAKDPLQRDRHRAVLVALRALHIAGLVQLRGLLVTPPYPQGQLRPRHAMLDHLVGELEVENVEAAFRVP